MRELFINNVKLSFIPEQFSLASQANDIELNHYKLTVVPSWNSWNKYANIIWKGKLLSDVCDENLFQRFTCILSK